MSTSTGPRRGLLINALTGDNFDVTFRAFLRAIDALLSAAVINLTTSAPPGSPANGDAYIVKASGTGAWTGHDNALAIWTTDNPATPGGLWEFYPAASGMIVVNLADSLLYYWKSSASAWTAIGLGAVTSVAGRTGAVVLGESSTRSRRRSSSRVRPVRRKVTDFSPARDKFSWRRRKLRMWSLD